MPNENEEKIYHCTECEEEIDLLDYSCRICGNEWGNYWLKRESHEAEDSETDDTQDYEYRCPCCDAEVDVDEVMETANKKIEEEKAELVELNEDGKPIKKKTPVESRLISSVRREIDKHYVVCKNCGQTNELEKDEEIKEGDIDSECTKCGQQLTADKTEQLEIRQPY